VPSRLAAPALRLIGYFPVTFAFASASPSPDRQTWAPDGNCDRCDREPNENGTSKDLSCNACVPYLQNRVFRRVWIKANGNCGADRIARNALTGLLLQRIAHLVETDPNHVAFATYSIRRVFVVGAGNEAIEIAVLR